MDFETAKMIEEKQRFIRAVEVMLLNDQLNNMVDSLAYKVDLQGDNFYDEYIDIVYLNGNTQRILTTCNSNGANLKAIIREVYR